MMQILIFTLEEKLFALDIENIELIKDTGDITRVPLAPYYIKGIIGLNGNIITVLDIKAILSLSKDNIEKNIIIFNVDKEKMGITVDKALEIVEIDKEKIELIQNNIFLCGVVEVKEKKISIINTNCII
ncbi:MULTISPECIES: chemotaxis protein CheW [Clostridium]|uniref:Chemotaxis protein CheW n=2 Tax=Clostridium cadaveris TaxID=1529 RepID=A0A316M2Q9_9CLOT|nr:chemotaxis protein CheW [Clostridium cadaveris]MDU4951275.1 chemotaxis protein CheW [Clostridium sp.]MDY4949502.1 chemotaxis protein CheW [Clostridium cadaveris]NME63881.1 chemotaxis protein CheW [Clostridium cadaveris]NWK10488.1 chemotaxis protein CheW [Clostridium cadaveris]PWL51868.1 MAG: chemotaxis protein CheW [Clostridium cadaveris]